MRYLIAILLVPILGFSQNRSIYYYQSGNSIIIEGLDRYPAQSLHATNSGDWVTLRDTIIGINELVDNYTRMRKSDGSQWASSAANTVDSLNNQFSKGVESGEGSFVSTNTSVIINLVKVKPRDKIFVKPKGATVGELIWVSSVSDGSFVVSREVLNTLTALTSGLTFEYIVISQ